MSTIQATSLSAAGHAALEALHAENRATGARLRACYALHQLCVDEQMDRDLASGAIDPDAERTAPIRNQRRGRASRSRPTPADATVRPGGGTPDHAVVDPMVVACAELVARYSVHHNRAHALITLAVLLVEQFPALLEAMEKGRIDERTASMLARHMRTVDSRCRHRVQRELVDWLLAALDAGQRPGRDALLSQTDQIIKRLDPDGVLARRAIAVRERNVRVQRQPDGMANLYAHLTAAEATSIGAVLDRTVAAALAREKAEREEAARTFADNASNAGASADAGTPAENNEPTSGDWTAATEVNDTGCAGVGPFGPRPGRGARRADALVDALLGTGIGTGARGAGKDSCSAVRVSNRDGDSVAAVAEDQGSRPGTPILRPQITVFAPIGPDDEPEVHFPRSSAASIDTLIALLSRSAGASISTSHTAPGTADDQQTKRKYRVSTTLARRIRLRDGTCRHPGCSVPAESCDIDHVVPFDRRQPDLGGTTEELNLMCLCRRHHRLKTFYTWRYSLSQDGTLTITTSSGQKLTTHPDGPLARWRHQVGDTVAPHAATSTHVDTCPAQASEITAAEHPPESRPRLNPTVRQTYWYRRACRTAAELQYGRIHRRMEEYAGPEGAATEEPASHEKATSGSAVPERTEGDGAPTEIVPAFDSGPPPF